MSCQPVQEPKYQGTCRRMRVIEPVPARWMVKLAKGVGFGLILTVKASILGLIYAETGNWWSVAFSVGAFFLGWLIYRQFKERAWRLI